MRQFLRGLLLVLLSVSVLGCGQQDLTSNDDSQDVELYAQNMRRMVLMQVELARGNDPETQMRILATELDHTDRPFGEYRDIYLAICDEANEAVEICQSNQNSKPPIDSHLDKLTRLAEKLPQNPDAPTGAKP
ncbi:MAG TPA: hypothetical protein VGM05_09905 [Planctomycetaceae bacterium]